MLMIESSETKLTDAEKRVLESVLNHTASGPAHIQSRQLRTAKNLARKGYLKPDGKFCYSGGYYWQAGVVTILNSYACGKEVHVAPKE